MERKDLRHISEILEEWREKRWGQSLYKLEEEFRKKEKKDTRRKKEEEEYLYK